MPVSMFVSIFELTRDTGTHTKWNDAVEYGYPYFIVFGTVVDLL